MNSLQAEIIKPPQSFDGPHGRATVFLAGSIEMGAAEDWQSALTKELASLPIRILNPRRDDWDSSWVQSIDNDQFREQVEWELSGLREADVIALYFAPETKSPISLLELGLHARSGTIVACCPDGFWRKGNVQVVCKEYRIPLYESRLDWIANIKKRLGQ